MKVLMFGWEFPPHITGGLGTACFGMTKGLARNGIETLFVVPKAYGDESEEAIRLVNASDVEVSFTQEIDEEFEEKLTYLEVESHIMPYVYPEDFERIHEETKTVKRKGQKTLFSTKFNFSGKYGTNLMEEVNHYAWVASTIAAKYDYDIIHAHDWLTYPAGIAAKQATGKPLVVHMHATEFDRSGQHVNQQVYDIERWGMEMADKVITVSNLTRYIVIERYGIPAEKVVTVHNAVEPHEHTNTAPYQKHVREKIVTFLGRITFQKGPEYFIEAAYKVLQRDKNVRFVMAGSGDLMNKMVRRAAQLGIADRFHFTGFLKGEDVNKMFGMSDVYVMPSVSEPFGISPLEAIRSNVPVIISKQSGVAEVLQHALKVDFWDIDALADNIYALLRYDVLTRIFEEKGKMEVDSLKWEKSAYFIKQVYSSLL